MILSLFYEAILTRLITNIPELKHFDIYFGQDEKTQEEDEFPFNCPAIFFEWESLPFESVGQKKQQAPGAFKLHILSDVIQEVSNKEGKAIRNKGHEHLLLLDKVFYQLQGFNSSQLPEFQNGCSFNTISRTGLPELYRPNDIMIKHIMTFKTLLTDVAAVTSTIPIPHPQNIELNLTIQDGDADSDQQDTITIHS